MSDSSAESVIVGLLRRTLCPTSLQTLLLRACLCGDVDAWEAWSRAVGDPKSELGNDSIGIKRLVPLLYTSLRDLGVPLDAEFLSYLRAAYVREELRARTFRRVCAEALGSLRESEIPFLVLKGVSLAESAYPTWALRHCHDLDLLVEHDGLARAIAALGEFRVYSEEESNVTLVHPTHLPVALHTWLFEDYLNPEGIYQEAAKAQITGVEVRVLAPHHELLHLCVHAASGPSRLMLLWVADALHLLRRHPSLDWDALLKAGQEVALPLYVMLGYLREEMGAAIPVWVLDGLGRSSWLKGKVLKGVTTTVGYRGLLREARRGREQMLVWGWMAGQIPTFYRNRMKRRSR